MSVVSDTGSGWRFGWSEFASVEAAPLVTCDLASGDLCLSRPWGWRDGETSVSSATEDKSEHEWLQNVFWQGWITNYIRYDVLNVVSINITVFWVVLTEAGRVFKMSEPAYRTKWHHIPNYCNHDIIKLSYRWSFMIYLFLIQLHEATKHHPNVIIVSFHNPHWILEQEGHNECWIQ